MTKVTIELPDTITVAMRNGASVDVSVADVSGLAAELFVYGVNQKIRDAASGATKAAEAEGSKGVQAEAQAMMETALSSLKAGEWSHRGDGAGTDPRTLVARSIVRRAVKEKFGSKSADWAKFTGLSDKEQLAKLDETYANNAAMFDPLIDAEIKRRADANKAKSVAAKSLEISL
jgi:hypothetical protein